MPHIIVSSDGSHTLLSDEYNVTYHSTHGSIQESNTVFIQAGLDHLEDRGYKKIDVFEMGFGTGLNALLAMKWAKNRAIEVDYTGIESHPIDLSIVQELNYPMLLDLHDEEKLAFIEMHSLPTLTSNNFIFTKVIGQIETYETQKQFDVIFFDAFAPSSQEHLWGTETLGKMFSMLRSGGCLVTYCAKGVVKRTLKEVGFTLESLPGPIGKREMTRANKL